MNARTRRTENIKDLMDRLNGAAKLMAETDKVVKRIEGNAGMRIQIRFISSTSGNTLAELNEEDISPDLGNEILGAVQKAHEFWTETLQEIAAELIDIDKEKPITREEQEGPQPDPEHGPIEQLDQRALKQEGPAPEL